ncbi:hypothetical protein [Chryseobacterium sp. Leaf394]|uniref:hypothetical protein n=1 Tax=Chryseobacterium sp. Leaf394 TaxID=1736361 RepID=UPI0006FB0A92|nr:hypothetical protein [Chryseobacterium sp. Leaf394]KQS94044.1 hypothetical protein ASG21_19775 [Chryseobacterium sp. Leaf394]
MKTKNIAVAFLLAGSSMTSAQGLSSLDKGLVIGNLLIQGYQAIKGSSTKKAPDPNSKTVDSFCFKNKMEEKIFIKLSAKVEDESIAKDLVIQKDGKECTYNLPKAVYQYEIQLSSKDVYKKGEYNVMEETLMTINHD